MALPHDDQADREQTLEVTQIAASRLIASAVIEHPFALLADHLVFHCAAAWLRAIQQHRRDRAEDDRERQLNPDRHQDDAI